MSVLMLNSEIAEKVKAKGKEGKSYEIFHVSDNGIVTLGETSWAFWNRLIGCQVKLPFESWALAVWDALVNLSKGANKEALIEGLSTEIAKKAQREEEYNWVVERLNDCFDHVCNNKGGTPSEGGRGKSGPSMTERVIVRESQGDSPVVINLNAQGIKRTLRFPDATGRASLNFDLGIVGVRVDKD